MQTADHTHEPAQRQGQQPVSCTVHVATRQVVVNGRSFRLGGRAFDLLMALHAHQYGVVPKQALHDAVWPGLAVTPNNLDVQVWALRRCLGPEAIRTVPRRGYALTPAVHLRLIDGPDDPPGEPPPPDGPQGSLLLQARALLPMLARTRRLALVGGNAARRTALCDAMCALYLAQSLGQVWRPRVDAGELHWPAAHRLRGLEQGAGLLVLTEAITSHRASLYGWAAARPVPHRWAVLVTAASPAPGVDTDVYRIRPETAPDADPAASPRPAPQGLRWTSRAGAR